MPREMGRKSRNRLYAPRPPPGSPRHSQWQVWEDFGIPKSRLSLESGGRERTRTPDFYAISSRSSYLTTRGIAVSKIPICFLPSFSRNFLIIETQNPRLFVNYLTPQCLAITTSDATRPAGSRRRWGSNSWAYLPSQSGLVLLNAAAFTDIAPLGLAAHYNRANSQGASRH